MHKQAEVLYQRALNIEEQLFGAKHPLTLLTSKEYAEFMQNTIRDAEAE
jgi:hypothetical protein